MCLRDILTRDHLLLLVTHTGPLFSTYLQICLNQKEALDIRVNCSYNKVFLESFVELNFATECDVCLMLWLYCDKEDNSWYNIVLEVLFTLLLCCVLCVVLQVGRTSSNISFPDKSNPRYYSDWVLQANNAILLPKAAVPGGKTLWSSHKQSDILVWQSLPQVTQHMFSISHYIYCWKKQGHLNSLVWMLNTTKQNTSRIFIY